MNLNDIFHPEIVTVLERSGIKTLDDLKKWTDSKVDSRITSVSEFENVELGFLSGYISGFCVCMQKYSQQADKEKMLFNESGEVDYHQTVVQMLKDFGEPGVALRYDHQ